MLTETSRDDDAIVERVARAIDPLNWKWLDSAKPSEPAYDTIRKTSLKRARAAIAAMPLTRAEQERAAIVAFLRAAAETSHHSIAAIVRGHARRIENGDHLRGDKEGST